MKRHASTPKNSVRPKKSKRTNDRTVQLPTLSEFKKRGLVIDVAQPSSRRDAGGLAHQCAQLAMKERIDNKRRWSKAREADYRSVARIVAKGQILADDPEEWAMFVKHEFWDSVAGGKPTLKKRSAASHYLLRMYCGAGVSASKHASHRWNAVCTLLGEQVAPEDFPEHLARRGGYKALAAEWARQKKSLRNPQAPHRKPGKTAVGKSGGSGRSCKPPIKKRTDGAKPTLTELSAAKVGPAPARIKGKQERPRTCPSPMSEFPMLGRLMLGNAAKFASRVDEGDEIVIRATVRRNTAGSVLEIEITSVEI